MEKVYKFEIKMNEDGDISASFYNGRTLSTTTISGNIILLEDEEALLNEIKKSVQMSMVNMAFGGKLSNFNISGNNGASK